MKRILTKTGLFNHNKFSVELDTVYMDLQDGDWNEVDSLSVYEFIDLIQINAYNVGKADGLKAVKDIISNCGKSDNDWNDGYNYAMRTCSRLIQSRVEDINSIIKDKIEEYSE